MFVNVESKPMGFQSNLKQMSVTMIQWDTWKTSSKNTSMFWGDRLSFTRSPIKRTITKNRAAAFSQFIKSMQPSEGSRIDICKGNAIWELLNTIWWCGAKSHFCKNYICAAGNCSTWPQLFLSHCCCRLFWSAFQEWCLSLLVTLFLKIDLRQSSRFC